MALQVPESLMANEVVDHGRRRFLTATTAVVGGVGVVVGSRALHQVVGTQRARQGRRCSGNAVIGKIEAGQKVTVSVAQPAGVRGQSHQGAAGRAAERGFAPGRSEVRWRFRQPAARSTRRTRPARSSRSGWWSSASARIWAASRTSCPRSSPSRSIRTGRAASTAPATSRATTWPAACSRACPRRRTCRCRRTTSSTTRTIQIGVDPKEAG